MIVERPGYRLAVAQDGLKAVLSWRDREFLALLRPLAALDRSDAVDETLSVAPPRLDGNTIEVERRSTIWDRAGLSLVCGDESVELRAWVEGAGDLTDVHLLGGRSLVPGAPLGFLPSGGGFRTLFSPNPSDHRVVRPASEPTVIGVTGDSDPGRHHWFFTPAPLYLALTGEHLEEVADADWVELAVAAPVAELGFVQLVYDAGDGGFSLRLEYEGHTRVEGEFQAPTLVLTPRAGDPYAGLRRHRDDLVARGVAPRAQARERPAWWSDPIFCGWGAQCHVAAAEGGRAADHATQARYDAFLADLEAQGVRPRTIVIDDKWQVGYGSCEPDPEKWPDLADWIAARHREGRHVLLWWKAWDPEGLPAELCVRNPDGDAVAVDPTNPEALEALRSIVTDLVGGIDADGLKIDFTARTPSGRALTHHGPGWGIALLHDLLGVVYAAAKEAKPDALVITHTPHPSFVDVTDMIRLNDMVASAASVVPQMRYRAEVVRAACPELPIDTDDWRIPSRDAWREYLAVKGELGVPSLYYTTHLDATGEPLEASDYDAVRSAWERWEAMRG